MMKDEAAIRQRFYRRFGKRVQVARKRRGWTQQELADRFGWTRSAISLLEHGGTGMPVHTAVRLSRILKARLW